MVKFGYTYMRTYMYVHCLVTRSSGVARHHQANLMVCVVCSCCATSPYREVCRVREGIGCGETLSHDIYPARPITTISLAANTYCMMDGHSSCTPHTVGPRVQFTGACEQSH